MDTFEDEETVDLEAVSAELKVLDKELVSTNETIKKYCDELGISTPF